MGLFQRVGNSLNYVSANPAGAAFDVEFEGDAIGDLNGMLDRLGDTSDLKPKLGELAMDAQKSMIEDSEYPDGSSYPPLKRPRPVKKTGIGVPDMWTGEIVRYASMPHPYGDKPLLDTTNMYQSIHYEYRSDDTPGTDSVWAGPSLEQAPYFPYQNQGAPDAGIPERTFIGLRDKDLAEIDAMTAAHVRAAVEGR